MLAACSSDDGDTGSAGTTTTLGEAPLVALNRLAPETADRSLPAEAPEPGGYRIVERRITKAAGTDEVERTIVRPFGERTAGGGTRSLAFLNETADAGRRVILARPGPNDPRPRVYAPDATYAKGGVRETAGRLCQVFRRAEREYCIDNTGLVLITADANTVTLATKVTPIDVPPEASGYTQQLAAGFTNPELGSVRPIDPATSAPGTTDYALAKPPVGFTHVGRYALVALSGALLDKDKAREVVAGIVDVYVRGVDTVVVDRGGRLDTQDVTERDLGVLSDATPINLGILGDGRVGIGGFGPFGYREVRAAPSQGRYVVVAGTLPADELVALARSLKAVAGTDLRYIDE